MQTVTTVVEGMEVALEMGPTVEAVEVMIEFLKARVSCKLRVNRSKPIPELWSQARVPSL
jgi:hypothetical protein